MPDWKDRFLASMIHELRVPLNAILGYTGILLMKLPGPLTSEQEKQIKNVEINANHLLSIVNDLLTISKIQSGDISLHLEKINCADLIKEVAASLSSLVESKELSLKVDVSEKSFEVKTDRRILKQILLNILDNAIKYTDKGRVTIKLHQSSASSVVIDISDTGIGIKEEDKTKLFNAFERIKQPEKLIAGTGLGLYISKYLIELLGGKIELKSEYGKGSCFSILIPDAG
jgi:protein-histidine pros-kinase